MTRAPGNILKVRTLLLGHLNVEPSRVRSQDLEPAEVGIVGDSAHRGGYHCGSDRVDSDDYSVRESSRDRNGLTLDASALDVGQFSVTTRKGTFDLQHFSRWLAGQCAAKAPDCRDIREVIYSPDGRVVRRWDALGRRSTGDDSHLWHTHISFFRDATKAGRDLTPAFRRYLTTIGLLEETVTEADAVAWATTNRALALLGNADAVYTLDGKERKEPNVLARDVKAIADQLRTIQTALATFLGQDTTDEEAIAAMVLSGLTTERLAEAIRASGMTPEALAAAIPPEMADQVVDLVAERLAGGAGQS